MTAHDPGFHDQRLAALLAGVPPATVAAAPGLARLLTSLLSAPPRPEEPALADADLLAQARADAEAAARADGEARGRAAAEAELAPLRAALTEAVAAARAATSIDEARLTPLLSALVKSMCEAVLMAELAAGGRVLGPLVAAALAEVAEAALPQLSAHPDTLSLIAGDLPPGLATRADAALPPGHVAVTGPDYRVDAGLSERLARLMEGLAWA